MYRRRINTKRSYNYPMRAKTRIRRSRLKRMRSDIMRRGLPRLNYMDAGNPFYHKAVVRGRRGLRHF